VQSCGTVWPSRSNALTDAPGNGHAGANDGAYSSSHSNTKPEADTRTVSVDYAYANVNPNTIRHTITAVNPGVPKTQGDPEANGSSDGRTYSRTNRRTNIHTRGHAPGDTNPGAYSGTNSGTNSYTQTDSYADAQADLGRAAADMVAVGTQEGGEQHDQNKVADNRPYRSDVGADGWRYDPDGALRPGGAEPSPGIHRFRRGRGWGRAHWGR